MEEKSCCFTGYRPSKFPFDISNENAEYNVFENALFYTLQDLVKQGYRTFYSGMAMGFDIIAAQNVLLLKNMYPEYDIKLICVLPFLEQISTFDEEWKAKHTDIIRVADDIIVSSDNYEVGCYRKRNEFMVDRCDAVVTWYDGKSGGTRNTLAYAAKTGKCIINLNKDNGFDSCDYGVYTLVEEEMA